MPIRTSILTLAAFMLSPSASFAQLSTTLSLVSDYRFRGESLSNDEPALQMNLAYDDPRGWYAGIFASQVRLGQDDNSSPTKMQNITYGGYAGRLEANASWEAGLSNTMYIDVHGYNYAEFFAGLSTEHVSTKIYLAPRYFGQTVRTLYGEINTFQPLTHQFSVIAHLGYLCKLSSTPAYTPISNQLDARVGISALMGAWNLQFSRVVADKQHVASPTYPDSASYSSSPKTWVASASLSF